MYFISFFILCFLPCSFSIYFSSLLHNKDPIQPDYVDNVAAFYVEGTLVRVDCVNRNFFPYQGDTFWVNPMNMPLRTGGVLEFNALRSQAGLYSCGVMLNDQSIMFIIPTRSFTLVVHCKL